MTYTCDVVAVGCYVRGHRSAGISTGSGGSRQVADILWLLPGALVRLHTHRDLPAPTIPLLVAARLLAYRGRHRLAERISMACNVPVDGQG